MRKNELEIFNELPFLCWAKDEHGKYIWANRLVSEWAGENVVGKTDEDLAWADYADVFRVADRQAWETREPVFTHEFAEMPRQGKVDLSICKWFGELDGMKCVYGISFRTEKAQAARQRRA